jgi:hypothetical protein
MLDDFDVIGAELFFGMADVAALKGEHGASRWDVVLHCSSRANPRRASMDLERAIFPASGWSFSFSRIGFSAV